jgi:inner membrane protein
VQSRSPQEDPRRIGPVSQLLLVTAGLSLLPDLDVIPGLLWGNMGLVHNSWTHSLLFGLIVALGVGSGAWLIGRFGFLRWFIIALLCYELHVIADFFTIGRGVMLFWPFSVERFISPVRLFYGLHWSDGWLTVRHLWTLLSELGSIVVISAIVYLSTMRDSLCRRSSS